jgi:lambda repressor-like predicted transcriptional regulator
MYISGAEQLKRGLAPFVVQMKGSKHTTTITISPWKLFGIAENITYHIIMKQKKVNSYSTLQKDKLLEHIGAELSDLQNQQGQTLQDLSRLSGVTYQTISRVLKGELENLSIVTLDNI